MLNFPRRACTWGLAVALVALVASTMYVAGPGGVRGVEAQAVPSLSLDMDITNGTGPCAPVDATTSVPLAGTFVVAVCLDNTGTIPLAAFQYRVNYDDTKIVAPEVADVGTALDDNPDANVGVTTFSSPNLGGGWDCSAGVGAYPVGDVDLTPLNGVGQAYSGGCGSAAGPNTLLSGPLGEITFTALAGGGVGPFALTISEASVTDDSLIEIGSCNPTVDTAMTCTGGDVTLAVGPTNTPTNTPTVTNTPVATATLCVGNTACTPTSITSDRRATATPTPTPTVPATAVPAGSAVPPTEAAAPTRPSGTTAPGVVRLPDTGSGTGSAGGVSSLPWLLLGAAGSVLLLAGTVARWRRRTVSAGR